MRNAGKIMVVGAVAAALVACSPSREEPTDLAPSEQPTHTPAPANSASPSASPEIQGAAAGERAAECTAGDIGVDTSGEQPQVTVPRNCTAPTQPVTAELESGSGTAAAAGSTVSVNYQALGWSDGQVGENTFQAGQPESISLGSPTEIEGLSQGLEGIRAGGTRVLVLPPDLGYGAQSGDPLAEDSLVVVAEAVDVS